MNGKRSATRPLLQPVPVPLRGQPVPGPLRGQPVPGRVQPYADINFAELPEWTVEVQFIEWSNLPLLQKNLMIRERLMNTRTRLSNVQLGLPLSSH